MNKLIKTTVGKLISGCFLAGALALSAHAGDYTRSAGDKNYPTQGGTGLSGYTNAAPGILNASATTNLTLNGFQLQNNNGYVGFATVMTGAGAGTSGVVFTFKSSLDNINYADTGFTWTNNLNGTTKTVAVVSLPVPTEVRYVKLVSVQNLNAVAVNVTTQFGDFQ